MAYISAEYNKMDYQQRRNIVRVLDGAVTRLVKEEISLRNKIETEEHIDYEIIDKCSILKTITSKYRSVFGSVREAALSTVVLARNSDAHSSIKTTWPSLSDLGDCVRILTAWLSEIEFKRQNTLVNEEYPEKLSLLLLSDILRLIEMNMSLRSELDLNNNNIEEKTNNECPEEFSQKDFIKVGRLNEFKDDNVGQNSWFYNLRHKKIVILDGQLNLRMGTFINWNGTKCNVLLDGELKNRSLSNKRKIGVLRTAMYIKDPNSPFVAKSRSDIPKDFTIPESNNLAIGLKVNSIPFSPVQKDG